MAARKGPRALFELKMTAEEHVDRAIALVEQEFTAPSERRDRYTELIELLEEKREEEAGEAAFSETWNDDPVEDGDDDD